MSKTITKQVTQQVCAAHLLAAFRLMGVPAAANSSIRLYAKQQAETEIALDAAALEKLGVRSAYGSGIGIDVDPTGQANLVYDHANEAAARMLAGLLPGLSQLGASEHDLQALLATGYSLRPHIDLQAQEFGVFLETDARLQAGGAGW